MSDILHAITSETDETKLSTLYAKLFQELQTMQCTLQEDDFMTDSMDSILELLARDTDIAINKAITSHTLYHIIPIVGFVLNSPSSHSANNSYKLYFNVLNIIRQTQELHLCIRCLAMFKSITYHRNNNNNHKMDSFLPLFYESTYQFMTDNTNRFFSNKNTDSAEQICLLRCATLKSYINLFFNQHQYELFLAKSTQWLSQLVIYLICDYNELQKVTIEFLLKFINHIKYKCDINAYNKYFSSNTRLFQALKSIIKPNTKNKRNPDKNTIFKLKKPANNNTTAKQVRNIRIWSIIIHCLGLNLQNDQVVINRLLKYIQTYFSSCPLLAFKHFRDLIFVLSLDAPKLCKRTALKLFYKIFETGLIDKKTKRKFAEKSECLQSWFYAISLLSKHNLLFHDDKKGSIPFQKLVFPLLNVIKTEKSEDICNDIIEFVTHLLRVKNEREMSPNDIDMKERENKENSIDINEIIDVHIKNYKWKFEYWSLSMQVFIEFATNINKRFGDDLSRNFVRVFLETFFKTIYVQNDKVLVRGHILNKYLGDIAVFLAENCCVLLCKHNLDKYFQWKTLNYISFLFGIYFENIEKYEKNIKQIKLKRLYNKNIFKMSLGDYNKNIVLFLMRLWLNKCESFDLFPFTDFYAKFLVFIKKNNNLIDCVYALQIYEDLIKKMIEKFTKMRQIKDNQSKLKQKLILTDLCRNLCHIFKQIFSDFVNIKVIKKLLFETDNIDANKKEMSQNIMTIYQNCIQLLFKFIAIFYLKFNENNKQILKMEYFEPAEKDEIFACFTLLTTNMNAMICKVLNGKYNKSRHEWIGCDITNNFAYFSKPRLNKFIENIHSSLSDTNHEIILMKWCKYKCNKYNNTDSDLILINFADLLIQFLCKSADGWYHSIDNKQLFQFISAIFLYIIHRNNSVLSEKWIKIAMSFIKSFNAFLSKLSMTQFVNMWCHNLSNRLLFYIKKQLKNNDSLLCLDEFENNENDKRELNNEISQCFLTYIHMTCNFSSIHLGDKILHKNKNKTLKNNDTNLQIQFIDLLHFILQLNNDKNNNNPIWTILSECIELKTKIIFKFITKTLKIKFDSPAMCTEYPLFIQLYKYKQTEQEKEKEKEIVDNKRNTNIAPIIKTVAPSTRSRKQHRKKREYVDLLDDSQNAMLPFSETQMGFDIFDEQFDDNIDVEMKSISGLNVDIDLDQGQEIGIIESSKSKSLDINDINELLSNENNKNNKLSGNKRKLDEIMDGNESKAKKMKLWISSEENESESFFPLLIGCDANIDTLLNILPQKLRVLLEKLPFNTINELAQCEKEKVYKYLAEAKTKDEPSDIGYIEYEVKEIINTMQRLLNKEKENGHSLDEESKIIESELKAAFAKLEGRNEFSLVQVVRIHEIIGKLSTRCIQLEIDQINKLEKQ